MNDYNLSFSTYSEVENDFERRVVEFEEKVSRDFIEHYKIIKSQNSKMIKDENLDTVINFSTELIGYLKTISGYKDFDKCDAATQKNIANNFSNHDDFGKPIGYVNSGGLFSNGKTGILFFENGLSVRSKMEKNEMSISYSNLCCGIVRKNNKYILAANKFSVSPILLNDNNKMFIIEPAEKMYSKMIVIRNILLSENDVVKSIYEICYQNILKMILDAFSKKAFQDAIDWCKILNEFAISNSNNNYVAPIELEILLNILNHNFITDNNYTPEWVEYTQNKNKEFRHIESIKYYYNAFIAINENEIENAISYIKKSIEYFSSAQSWELYVKIISEKAKKENLFMYNYTLELLSREEELMNAKDISESTINTFNKIKIDYSIFQKNLRNEIITRIKSNDIDFFKDNISLVKNYIDDLGMSPLHYAALLKNSTVLSIIYDSTANKNNIDLLKLRS